MATRSSTSGVSSLHSIMDEREESMISPEGGSRETRRIGRFLKPCHSSDLIPEESVAINKTTESTLHYPHHSMQLSSRVIFSGWRYPREKWIPWVKNMQHLYQSVWKETGIHEAILNSEKNINRAENVIFGFAQKWCPVTNTFLLSWGEITITLQDMMMIGGFKCLVGEPLDLETRDSQKIDALLEVWKQYSSSKDHKVLQSKWLKRFMGSESAIEHEAFLSMWLSEFVFPSSSGISSTIDKKVFPIAVHLAKGTKIALAPAVLASIYRDLSLLKERLDAPEGEYVSKLKVHAPLQLLQIWVWERFPALSPGAKLVDCSEPRFARWDQAKKIKVENVLLAIESAGKEFLWRPYSSDPWPIYRKDSEKEMYSVADSDSSDEEFDSYARCLRVSELVGPNNTIEHYFPHRVAMQFGIDQDLPAHISPATNRTPARAWKNYIRPVEDEILYIPSSSFEPQVTTRYLRWWNQSKSSEKSATAAVEGKNSTCPSLKRKMGEGSSRVTEEDMVPICRPGLSPRNINSGTTGGSSRLHEAETVPTSPPVFTPTCINSDAGGGSSQLEMVDELSPEEKLFNDKITVLEMTFEVIKTRKGL